MHDDVLATLARHRAALVLHDLLPRHPFELTTTWTYLRFHGPDAVHQPYHGRYTGRRLWRVAERIAAWDASGHDVYAYFNNDHSGAAVVDTPWLTRRRADATGQARAERYAS